MSKKPRRVSIIDETNRTKARIMGNGKRLSPGLRKPLQNIQLLQNFFVFDKTGSQIYKLIPDETNHANSFIRHETMDASTPGAAECCRSTYSSSTSLTVSKSHNSQNLPKVLSKTEGLDESKSRKPIGSIKKETSTLSNNSIAHPKVNSDNNSEILLQLLLAYTAKNQ